MSRWIDADAIKDKAWKAESEACFYALEDVVSVTDIDEAPSINIVRCKECKYKRIYDGETKYYYCALEDRPNRQWSILKMKSARLLEKSEYISIKKNC